MKRVFGLVFGLVWACAAHGQVWPTNQFFGITNVYLGTGPKTGTGDDAWLAFDKLNNDMLILSNDAAGLASGTIQAGNALGVTFSPHYFSTGYQYPTITISPWGIANGMSMLTNNGAMFGPDTPLWNNASQKSWTCGLQEAWNSIQAGTNWFRYDIPGARIQLFDGTYALETNVVFFVTNTFSFEMDGNSILGTRLLYEPTTTPSSGVDVLGFYDNGSYGGSELPLPWEIALKNFQITAVREMPYTTLIAVDPYTFTARGNTTLYRQTSGDYSTFEADDVAFTSYTYITNSGGTGNQLSIVWSGIPANAGYCTIGIRIRGGDEHQTLFNNCYFMGLADGADISADHVTMNDCKSAFTGAMGNYYTKYALPGTLTSVGTISTFPNYAFAYGVGAVLIHNGVVDPGLQWELNHCHFYADPVAVFDLGLTWNANGQTCIGDRLLDCEFESGFDEIGPSGDILYDAGDGGNSNQVTISPQNAFVFPRLINCVHDFGSFMREAELPQDICFGWTNFFNNRDSFGSACWYGAGEYFSSGGQTNDPRFQAWVGTNEIQEYFSPPNSGAAGTNYFGGEVAAGQFAGDGSRLSLQTTSFTNTTWVPTSANDGLNALGTLVLWTGPGGYVYGGASNPSALGGPRTNITFSFTVLTTNAFLSGNPLNFTVRLSGSDGMNDFFAFGGENATWPTNYTIASNTTNSTTVVIPCGSWVNQFGTAVSPTNAWLQAAAIVYLGATIPSSTNVFLMGGSFSAH